LVDSKKVYEQAGTIDVDNFGVTPIHWGAEVFGSANAGMAASVMTVVSMVMSLTQ